MTRSESISCPECGEDAVRQPPSDLVPWEAHGLARPEWSHRDGSSLCPVIAPSGGFRPAHPQSRPADADIQTARLEPPATTRPTLGAEIARHLAEPADPGQQHRREGRRSRRYMTRVIAQIGDLHRQARADAEPEAGA